MNGQATPQQTPPQGRAEERAGAVTVRPARPERDDLLAFARYYNMASEDMVKHIFGDAFEAIVEADFHHPQGLHGYRNVQIAVVDGIAAGAINTFAYDQMVARGDEHMEAIMRAAGPLAGEVMANMGAVKPLLMFMHHLPAGSAYVHCVGVDSRFRRRGIARTLLQAADAFARDQGCRALELDVTIDNDGAIRAYEQHGMAVTATSPEVWVPWLGRNIQAYRMVKPLA
jgi:ribosomal protein S18 acetylase RimI-like enzyme